MRALLVLSLVMMTVAVAGTFIEREAVDMSAALQSAIFVDNRIPSETTRTGEAVMLSEVADLGLVSELVATVVGPAAASHDAK